MTATDAPGSISGGGGRHRWSELPVALRARVESALGSPVASAVSQPGGFSPGSADRVVTADGRAAFVKAVSASVNVESVAIHRREAGVLAAMPPGLPIARLVASVEEGDWVALVLEDVPGRHPALPWRPDELDLVLDAYADLAAAPLDGEFRSLLEPLARHLPSGWAGLTGTSPLALSEADAAWCRSHLAGLQALERDAFDLVDGDRLVHLDARADNVLLRPDGSVAVVDWPWAVRGPAWFDPLALLVNVRLFDAGFNAGTPIGRHRAFAGMPQRAVPAVLAALAGFFTAMGSQPPPPGLPTLRRFQLDQAAVTLAWLRELLPS